MLSLVIPTYNELSSLEVLLPKLEKVSTELHTPLEIIVVDDNSPDGTAEFAQGYRSAPNVHLRVVRRDGKFGLASAVIEGWRTARGRYLGVIDADGSHDESILPQLLAAVREGTADLAVGSRYVPGGGMGDWPLHRRTVSVVAIGLGRLVCSIRDLTSGYLVFRREVLEGVSLDPIGFKIGLEVMVRGRYRTFVEVPYMFADRTRGASKLGGREVFSFVIQVLRLFVHRLRHPHQRRTRQRVKG